MLDASKAQCEVNGLWSITEEWEVSQRSVQLHWAVLVADFVPLVSGHGTVISEQ